MFTLSVIAQNTPLFWVLISSVFGAARDFGLQFCHSTDKSTAQCA
jgi:hypothetical protein